MSLSDRFDFAVGGAPHASGEVSASLDRDGRDASHDTGWFSMEQHVVVPSPPGTPDLQFLDQPAWHDDFNDQSPVVPSLRLLPPRPPLSPPNVPWEVPDQPQRPRRAPDSRRDVGKTMPSKFPGISLLPPTPSRDIVLPVTPGPDGKNQVRLRKITEIPEMYRSVFKGLPRFNIVQSQVFDDVMYTDKPIVVCAPTGSGKTAVFELAIIHLLMHFGQRAPAFPYKIVYVSPIKALCAERWNDWSGKFSQYGLVCKELTGDTDMDEFQELQKAHIIITTPEKWDSMTRKWKDNVSFMELVRLFCIDEVHLLSDNTRGPTMEAVISRMKTIQSSIMHGGANSIRFVAVSATVPNADDVAAWLSTPDVSTSLHCLSEEHRPVRLRKVVLSFPSCKSSFRFDMSLSYKLSHVIRTYAEDKPTLVFCSTRKGVQQAATVLVKEAHFQMTAVHRQRLQHLSYSLKDAKLRDAVICGVAFHHAGLDYSDRSALESLFASGDLPVLIATSTLAMGVNLPAHLVVVKSTQQYVSGGFSEYSESQVVQMIGRAGRPQFDTTATAVIMTRHETRKRYETLVSGTQMIESSLHHSMVEHINAEVVLSTITDINIALQWIKSTFLYIRMQKNPVHYGMTQDIALEMVEKKLLELCVESLKELDAAGLVCLTDDLVLTPTDTGRIMARYYVTFDTMRRFVSMASMDSLKELLSFVSGCKEFDDLVLRVTEKRSLNTLNADKHRETIRFPLTGKIKSTEMKINCLIQATLGCLPILEMSLSQDAQKIFRNGVRITRCLVDCLMISGSFSSLSNALLLAKCFKARLWENSKLIARQLDKIGITMATALNHAGLTSWERIEESNPRRIEMIVNRNPPFGNQVLNLVAALPRLGLHCIQTGKAMAEDTTVEVTVKLRNLEHLQSNRGSVSPFHCSVLVVGNGDNQVIYKQRLWLSMLLKTGLWTKRVSVQRAVKSDELHIHLISTDYAGLDVTKTMDLVFAALHHPRYTAHHTTSTAAQQGSRQVPKPKKMRRLSCMDSVEVADDTVIHDGATTLPLPLVPRESIVQDYMQQLHLKQEKMPETPAKRLRLPSRTSEDASGVFNMNLDERFGYRRSASGQQISAYSEETSSQQPLFEEPRAYSSPGRESSAMYSSQGTNSARAFSRLLRGNTTVGFQDHYAAMADDHPVFLRGGTPGGSDDDSDAYLYNDSLSTSSSTRANEVHHTHSHGVEGGDSSGYFSLDASLTSPHGSALQSGLQTHRRGQARFSEDLAPYPDIAEVGSHERHPPPSSIPPHFRGLPSQKQQYHISDSATSSGRTSVTPGRMPGPSSSATLRSLVKNTSQYTLVRTGENPAPVAIVPPRSRSPPPHNKQAIHQLPQETHPRVGDNQLSDRMEYAPDARGQARSRLDRVGGNPHSVLPGKSRKDFSSLVGKPTPLEINPACEPAPRRSAKKFTFIKTRKDQEGGPHHVHQHNNITTAVPDMQFRQSMALGEKTNAGYPGCPRLPGTPENTPAVKPATCRSVPSSKPRSKSGFGLGASDTVVNSGAKRDQNVKPTSASIFCTGPPSMNLFSDCPETEEATLDGVFDGLLWS